jgi:hypothetical protein
LNDFASLREVCVCGLGGVPMGCLEVCVEEMTVDFQKPELKVMFEFEQEDER